MEVLEVMVDSLCSSSGIRALRNSVLFFSSAHARSVAGANKIRRARGPPFCFWIVWCLWIKRSGNGGNFMQIGGGIYLGGRGGITGTEGIRE